MDSVIEYFDIELLHDEEVFYPSHNGGKHECCSESATVYDVNESVAEFM